MDSIYEILMGLPLFKGVSYKCISEVVAHTKFHFLKYLPGETMINAGDACTHIKFIISGQVRSSVANGDGRFSVSQTLTGPDVIGPEYLFGRTTRYPATVIATTSVSILQIEKSEWLKVLNSDSVFMFNYLNLLSSQAQRMMQSMLWISNNSLEERLAYWILSLTQRGGTEIVLTCKQRNLYAFFGVQRSSFVATLDSLKARGIIDYDTTEIRVTNRQDLVDMLMES